MDHWTVQTMAEEKPLSECMSTALCDLRYGALEKHLLTYLFTYLLRHSYVT